MSEPQNKPKTSSRPRQVSVTKLSIFLAIFTLLTLFNSFILYLTLTGLDKRDFARFFYSAVAHLEGGGMYGPTPATLIRWSGLYAEHLWNLNPPIFHVLLFPLTSLSLETAFAIWGVLSMMAFLVFIRILTQELKISFTLNQVGVVILGVLAFAGTGALLYTGQLSLVLLLPFTLAWVNARNRNWVKSGIFLGVLSSIKPFFLIFLPFFILRRLFPGLLAFLGAFLGMFGLGLWIFGVDVHLEWFRVLGEVDWTWSWINASIHGFLRRMLTETPVFLPLISAPAMVTPLYVILAGIVGVTTVFLSRMDDTQYGIDRNFCLLIVAALLISPAGWIYYFFFCMGPLAGLWKAWMDHPRNTYSSFHVARNVSFGFALPGLLFPLLFVPLLSPNQWVTISLASIYFWSALFLWVGLVFDQLSQITATSNELNCVRRIFPRFQPWKTVNVSGQ